MGGKSIWLVFLAFAAGACTSGSQHIDAGMPSVLWPTDSSVLYFRTLVDVKAETTNEIDAESNRRFSALLFEMGEPVLKDQTGNTEIYRYSFLSPHDIPYAYRVQRTGSNYQLVAKGSTARIRTASGQGVVNDSIPITAAEFSAVKQIFLSSNFWQMPTLAPPDHPQEEGSYWVVEGVNEGGYHVVARWTPVMVPAPLSGILKSFAKLAATRSQN